MADNVSTPIEPGTEFATKEIAGVQFPKNLLTDGLGVEAIGDVGADPVPETMLGRLKAISVLLDAIATADAAIIAKLSADPATQATLAALLAKTTADPATATLQAAASAKLDALATLLITQAGYLDGVEGALASILAKLSADPATQTTAAAILAKLSADPATQTTLAAVLAKLSADPATQTTLNAVLAKLSADPATQTTLEAIRVAMIAATPAGENHIGQVGGALVVASDVPAITASAAYASGNCIGGKLTFAGLGRIAGLTGLIQMGLVHSKSNQAFAADLILFHTDPATSVFTDKAAVAVAAADFDKILGKISFLSTDWANVGTPSLAQQSALAMAYKVAAGATNIYGVLVSRGTPTFASTTDLKVVVKGLLD